MSTEPLSPLECVYALEAEACRIAPRAGGKRLNLSLVYHLQRLIEFDKEWIPVEKEIPDDKAKQPGHGLCNVLITYRHAGIRTVGMAIFHKGEFYLYGFKDPVDAIAWKPLPKPYTPKTYLINSPNSEVLPEQHWINHTLHDIVAEVYPSSVRSNCDGGIIGCPGDYSITGIDMQSYCLCLKGNLSHSQIKTCQECWNQKYQGNKEE